MPRPRSKGNGEGSIFQRKRDGKWICEIVLNHGTPEERIIRCIDESKAKVEKWRRARLTERDEGTLVAPTKQTVGQFMEEWITKTAPMQVGPSTLRLYHNALKWYIMPAIGHVPLAQLKPAHIQGMLHQLIQDGKSPRTAQLARIVLRRAVQQAVEWSELPRNPVDLVKPPRIEHKEMKVLSPEEIVRFLQAAKTERLHAVFVLAVTTGLRRGELLGLRWQDLDLTNGKLTVAQTMKIELLKDDDGKEHERWTFGQTKTKSSRRTIDLPGVAIQALRRWKAEQNEERLQAGGAWECPELVFTSEVGTPVHPKNLRDRGFFRVLERAGLPRIRFHDLRHSFATFLAIQGVSDRTMQEVLGHSSINTTKTFYVHVLAQQRKEAAEKFDNFLAATEKKAQK